MRWLLIKDLRILQRSPLLVGLLVIYPVVIAVLIGFALSRGPDKPEVAFYNGLSEGTTVELGGQKIDLTEQGAALEEIDPCHRERDERSRSPRGRCGGASIPDDLARTSVPLEPDRRGLLQRRDPSRRSSWRPHRGSVQQANAALTKRSRGALDLLS